MGIPNPQRLERVQRWLGRRTFGAYLGVYTSPWRAGDFTNNVIKPWQNLGKNRPDYAMVKVGEWGTEWYDGTFPAIRKAFLDAGFGCAPYFFCRPQTWQRDAAICAKLAQEAGGVILDCEEQFIGYSSQLDALVAAVRQQAGPDPVVIVSGYGDPITAVPSWDFTCLHNADAYQPQWYIGWWDLYKRSGFERAILWGDGQCGQKFVQANLGMDYPIQPAVNVEGVNVGDMAPMARWLCDGWKASVAVWETRDITDPMYLAFRQGAMGATSLLAPMA